MSAQAVNRRDLIRGASVLAGGIAFSGAIPWLAAPVGAERPTLAALGDFDVDDVWGAYPGYAEPIDYPRPQEPEARVAAAAGSIDTLFYA